MEYLIQFVAGTDALVEDLLPQSVPGARVVWSDDSAMLVSAKEKVTPGLLPYANNVFMVITKTARKNLAGSVRQLGERAQNAQFPRMREKRGFRLMFQIDGVMASIDRNARSALERDIALRTGSRVESRGNCQEFWVIGRRGLGDLLLCARMERGKTPERPKGALSPELSAMLVALSKPHKLDTFLDPFGGTGALVLARSHSAARGITYSDIHLERYRDGFHRNLTHGNKVRLLAEDALTLPSIADGEISAIVTDPPWGEFTRMEESYVDFAKDLARSFNRVLHPLHGRFVLLSTRRNAATVAKALRNIGFALDDPIDILVNGHPASVISGWRIRPDRD